MTKAQKITLQAAAFLLVHTLTHSNSVTLPSLDEMEACEVGLVVVSAG